MKFPQDHKRLKILVGMSGGVDSSVAAALLVEQGYDVTGGFIKNWSDTKDLWTGECQWRGERRDALRVAAKLGISLLTFDFEKEYRSRVLDRMFQEYEAGITPNPDVLCNQEIKFGLFFEAAMKAGFDGIAMGHYSRVVNQFTREYPSKSPLYSGETFGSENPLSTGGRGYSRVEGGVLPVAHLLKAIDPEKDQSYFLHRVSQEALSRSLFPIGHLLKSEVRALAEKFDLPVAQKPDSQGICFIGKLDFHDFLRKKIPATPGDIVTPEGEVIGTHDGLDAHTIGQRHGLKVSKEGKTWYVAGKNLKKNQLIVVSDREHPLLYRSELHLRNIHWIAGAPSNPEIKVAVRYHAPLIAGTLTGAAHHLLLSEGRTTSCCLLLREEETSQTSPPPGGGVATVVAGVVGSSGVAKAVEVVGSSGVVGASIVLRTPAWAPAPGQSAVLYQGDECLGGGFIVDDLVK